MDSEQIYAELDERQAKELQSLLGMSLEEVDDTRIEDIEKRVGGNITYKNDTYQPALPDFDKYARARALNEIENSAP